MKTISMRLGFAFILCVMTTNCGEDNMPKYQALGDLRILTIVVDKPEADAGEIVTFTPVLSDLNGNGRTINYTVQACIDPGVGVGADPECQYPDPVSMQTGTVTIPAGASLTYTGPIAPFSLTMPDANAIFTGRNDADKYNGVIYLVQYNISITNGPAINSFLRVFVSDAITKTQKNQNPSIASVDLNDSPILGSTIPMPTAASNFRVTSSAGSSETYQVMQYDGSFLTRTEEMLNTWFISDGTIEYSRTIGNTGNLWTPPGAKPAGRGIVLLVVTRDGRGGAAFQKIEMN
jgi:hypothetical protein